MPDSQSTAGPVTVKADRGAFYFIALAPVLAIFAVIPLELYTTAAKYWRWNTDFPLTFLAAGLVVYVVLLLLLFILGSLSDRAFKSTALGLFFLGIFLLLADILAPLQTGLLDGSALESDEPLFYTLIEIVLLGLVLLFAVRLKAHSRKIAVIMTTFLLLLSTVYALYAAVLGPPPAGALPPVDPGKSRRGNIYHIVLDEMQSDAAAALVRERSLQDVFAGFTLYENNIANYLFTNVSMPSYLTGDLYRAGDFGDWQESFKDSGLFRRLYEEGFTLQLYPVYDHWCSPYAQSCRSLDEIFEQRTGLLGADYITFIQIWFARLMPNAVSNRALAAGKRLGHFVDARVNAAARDIPKTIPRGRAPYSSVLMLDELRAREPDEAPRGRYVYAHTIIPHGPYVMNEDCRYDGVLWKTLGGKQAYYQQSACALGKVAQFLDELKRLDRYRDATIVVHADTGHGHQGFIEVGDDGLVVDRGKSDSPPVELHEKFIRSEEWYLSRAMALLMVKPPGATGDLQFSTYPSHLTDIYPTVLAMAQIPDTDDREVVGRSLFPEPTGPTRESQMFFTTPARLGEVTPLRISNQADIPAARLVIEDRREKVQAGASYSVTLGLDDAALALTGFSYPEQAPDGSRHWRWATGRRSSIDFSGRLQLEPGPYLLTLELEPFTGNVATTLDISLAGQGRQIDLHSGWQSQEVPFEFEGGEEALLEFGFQNPVSPHAMGMSADQRELSARIQRIEIRPVR